VSQYDDEVRPYHGEKSEAISAPEWRNSNDGLRRGTPAERYAWRLAEGLCPGAAGSCGGTVDEAGFCSMCGQTWQPLTAARDSAQPDFIPTLPGALTIDEFAPCDLAEGEAA
jgi:hypothetical protein